MNAVFSLWAWLTKLLVLCSFAGDHNDCNRPVDFLEEVRSFFIREHAVAQLRRMREQDKRQKQQQLLWSSSSSISSDSSWRSSSSSSSSSGGIWRRSSCKQQQQS